MDIYRSFYKIRNVVCKMECNEISRFSPAEVIRPFVDDHVYKQDEGVCFSVFHPECLPGRQMDRMVSFNINIIKQLF